MIIRLYQPPTKNWLLVAEELDDPPTWDRFVPCHTTKSQRWQFECAVKETGAESGLTLKPCKEMLCCGLGVFEYDWNSNDDDILSHAMQVAERFGLELAMGSPADSYSAA